MKTPVFFTLLFILLASLTASAQSTGFVVRIHGMQPATDPFNDYNQDASGSLNIGISKTSTDRHFTYDVTAFGDLMGYRYYVDQDRYLNGSTLFSGLAITPSYCFNPGKEVEFSVGLGLKAGFNWGYGIVHEYAYYDDDPDPRVESRSVSAGFASAFAPMVMIGVPTGSSTKVGFELGYDSSNYGKGVNKLRSDYYGPLNFNSGGVFLGVYVRFF